LITPYTPDKRGYGNLAIIIFPGGGYRQRSEHEGAGYAEYFTSEGITCFVVDYRVAPEGGRHPAMIEDALAAIGTIRARAREFGGPVHGLADPRHRPQLVVLNRGRGRASR